MVAAVVWGPWPRAEHMDQRTQRASEALQQAFPASRFGRSAVVWQPRPDVDVLTVPAEHIVTVRRVLRDHTGYQFTVLSELTAADYPSREVRFQVVYSLLSLRYGRRLLVKVDASEALGVPTVTGVFPAANWYEREVYDRFGLVFRGHPDRRRILTDYGFEGHPLRKDFPLTGFTEVRYDEVEKRVVSEPLQLSQERRRYQLDRPWTDAPEGTSRG